MAQIRSLSSPIYVDPKKFREGLEKASRAVKKFGAELNALEAKKKKRRK